MKNTIIIVSCFLISISTFGQSLSTSKILNYLDIQVINQIGNELKLSGFVFNAKTNADGFRSFAYTKKGRYGIEKINVAYNDELFTIVYKMPMEFYSAMKEKMVTNNFVYSYSFKNIIYYESDSMRIGINDASGILSFFVKLN